MGFDTRFQLVDLQLLEPVLEALLAGAPPPPSAFDRLPDAAALWEKTLASWNGSDPAAAAQALCWLAVRWSAASLPSVTLRNVALTHHPLRMPDAYRHLGDLEGIEAPVLLPLLLDEEKGACAPQRLDSGAMTGAFIGDAHRAGVDLAAHIDGMDPDARRAPARLLALLRAAERSDLVVWEALDCGDAFEGAPDPRWTLAWPGLPSRFALEAPLTEAEWSQVDGRWHQSLGDLEDLLLLATWTHPADTAARAHARRALDAALAARAPAGHSFDPRARDARALVERVTQWLEGARGAGEGVSPREQHAQLRKLYTQLRTMTPVPPEHAEDFAARWHGLYVAAPELAAMDQVSDGYVFRDTAPVGLLLRRFDVAPTPALAKLVLRLLQLGGDDSDAESTFHRAVRARGAWIRSVASVADAATAKEIHTWQRRSFLLPLARAYDADLSDPAEVERIADAWHALYLVDPVEAAREKVSDSTGAVLAQVLLRLDGAPDAALGRMVLHLLERGGWIDEDRDANSPLVRATRERLAWLRALASAVRAEAPELAASLDEEITRWSLA